MEWVKVTNRLPPDDVAVVLGWKAEPGRWAQWREVWYSRCGWASDFAFWGVTHWAIPTGPCTPSNAGGNATERSEGRVDHNVGRQTEE